MKTAARRLDGRTHARGHQERRCRPHAKCVAAYRNELKRLRTGRASTSLVDHIRVDYYGAESPLQQVANVAVEDARTLTIVP